MIIFYTTILLFQIFQTLTWWATATFIADIIANISLYSTTSINESYCWLIFKIDLWRGILFLTDCWIILGTNERLLKLLKLKWLLIIWRKLTSTILFILTLFSCIRRLINYRFFFFTCSTITFNFSSCT